MKHKQGLFGDELRPMMLIRQSIMLLLFRVVAIHIAFLLIVLICGGLLSFFEIQSITGGFAIERLYLTTHLLELLVLGYILFSWHQNYYILTLDRVVVHKGVFIKRQDFYALKNIESINLRQGLFGTIFNFGTVKLYAPTLNKKISMRGINSPKRKHAMIEKLLPSLNSQEQDRMMFVRSQ